MEGEKLAYCREHIGAKVCHALDRVRDADSRVIYAYLQAKREIIEEGYGWELEWQAQVSLESINECDFLREVGWVIVSCGLREQSVRCIFDRISSAFLEWHSAELIMERHEQCRARALRAFRHQQKIDAIFGLINYVSIEGFTNTKNRLAHEGIEFIRQFRYMGPVTSYHLAKNIGLDVVKPDRHLTRIAQLAGYDTPNTLCRDIASVVGDKLSVVDIVIWRYANLYSDYLERFEEILALKPNHEGDDS